MKNETKIKDLFQQIQSDRKKAKKVISDAEKIYLQQDAERKENELKKLKDEW